MSKPEEMMEKIKDVAINGLLTDGGHHKQHSLEEILALVADIEQIKSELAKQGYLWEAGIPS